jgi:hypothetical protein
MYDPGLALGLYAVELWEYDPPPPEYPQSTKGVETPEQQATDQPVGLGSAHVMTQLNGEFKALQSATMTAMEGGEPVP